MSFVSSALSYVIVETEQTVAGKGVSSLTFVSLFLFLLLFHFLYKFKWVQVVSLSVSLAVARFEFQCQLSLFLFLFLLSLFLFLGYLYKSVFYIRFFLLVLLSDLCLSTVFMTKLFPFLWFILIKQFIFLSPFACLLYFSAVFSSYVLLFYSLGVSVFYIHKVYISITKIVCTNKTSL